MQTVGVSIASAFSDSAQFYKYAQDTSHVSVYAKSVELRIILTKKGLR